MLEWLFRQVEFNLWWLLLDEGSRRFVLERLRVMQPRRVWVLCGVGQPVVIGA